MLRSALGDRKSGTSTSGCPAASFPHVLPVSSAAVPVVASGAAVVLTGLTSVASGGRHTPIEPTPGIKARKLEKKTKKKIVAASVNERRTIRRSTLSPRP